MVYSNLLFIIFFVVLIINCVSLPNLAICSSIYICNISIFVLAILFMIFINYFQEGFKSSFISNSGLFYPISRVNRSLYLKKKKKKKMHLCEFIEPLFWQIVSKT